VETLKQNEDHTYFVILQNCTILNPTTTIILQWLYVYNPPKIFPKFKNYFLAGILSNTFGAEMEILPMLRNGLDQVQP
jgi:hypothetical protein